MRMGIICVCVCVYTMRKDEFGCKERMCTLPRGHEMAFIFFNLVCTSVRYTSLYTRTHRYAHGACYGACARELSITPAPGMAHRPGW